MLHPGHIKVGNAPAGHFAPEPFRDYAWAQLQAAPPWQPGTCFHPDCGCAFAPTRPWQIYCSPACARAGEAEMRRWGHRAALPLLCWRLGKYDTANAPRRDLARAAIWPAPPGAISASCRPSGCRTGGPGWGVSVQLSTDQKEILRLRVEAGVVDLNAALDDAVRFGIRPHVMMQKAGDACSVRVALQNPVPVNLVTTDPPPPSCNGTQT